MRDEIVFYVNDTRHSVRGGAAGLTLTDYLRYGASPDAQRLCGTKVACAEGDCGACTVLVGDADPSGEHFSYKTVDACIAFVYQMDRRHVITVEGLASSASLAPTQQAMVDCHGSQCGFCTPGFVMALQGLVEEGSSLSDDDLRLGLSGNLCRCTGYSQILDAGHAIEPSTASVASQYDAQAMLKDFAELTGPVHLNPPSEQSNGAATKKPPVEVFLPESLDQLIKQKADRPEAKLVAGATDLGVQHNHGRFVPTSVITTSRVAELDRLEIVDNELVIGAAVRWSRVEDFVRDRVPEYHHILTRFGSPQVRHAGTLVGNLANASPIADSIPFHYVADSTIELRSVDGEREVAINDFYLGYKELDLHPNEVITAVRTPLPSATTRLKLYKISKRRDMDISTVTAAFWLELEGDAIASARVALGGVAATVLRAPEAESALVGKPITEQTLRSAGQLARDAITPLSDVRGGADYRRQLVENLFVKCFHDLQPEAVTQ